MQKTTIEWSNYVSNPIRAKRKATGKLGHACYVHSPGCQHCWASTFNMRLGTGLAYTRANLANVEMVLDTKELRVIQTTQRKGLCFICDMLDLFGDHVPDDYIAAVFDAMRQSHSLTFQVLTKDAQRMKDMVSAHGWDYPNLWLMTSVENDKFLWRVEALLETPARTRVLSVEPLLSDLDLSPYLSTGKIHGVIVGGESGEQARPMHPDWARRIRDDCARCGVKFFFKQWGEYEFVCEDDAPLAVTRKGERVVYHNGRYALMARSGKHKAGAQLDGRAHRELPPA
jgi:protein gp37